ncbi:MAG: nucleotidyltransferase family protein [Candidatus Omnitrophica bacterium]|nr:nucleotidyltransferase family protein [Candidatus Omnitrophota bacterium]
MKVVLLCAGYATRLYPLTKDNPKPLLPVGEKPILEWILDKIKELKEVNAVYLVSNHPFSSHFEKWKKGKKFPWPLEVVDDQTCSNEERLGAIGDLKYVLSQKAVGEEDLLVIAGDNFFDFDLRRFIAFSEAMRPHAVIAVYDVRDRELAKRYGLVETDKDERVLKFYEKPENPSVTLASCGIYWLPVETRVLLDRYLEAGHNSDQPGYYMRWLSESDVLFAARMEGQWLDIGDPASYERANALFRKS